MPTIMNTMFEYIEKNKIINAEHPITQSAHFGPGIVWPPATHNSTIKLWHYKR
jgi:hypothetical protein